MESSYTIGVVRPSKLALEYLEDKNLKCMADLGCVHGILTFIIAEFIGVKRVYTIDIANDRLEFLRNVMDRSSIDVITSQQDFCKSINLPEKVHLITSFGSLEHVICWDEVVDNIKNDLDDEGYLLISIPNLKSWINRVLLLTGYQPRDLEISKRKPYGIHSFCSKNCHRTHQNCYLQSV